MIIRPITQRDLNTLVQIAEESGPGFTSLMPDRAALARKIAHSMASFERKVTSPGDEHYLFVLEDETTGDILGTTGIEANTGHTRPLYHFRRNTVVHHSRDLDLRQSVETLTRCNHYTGYSEICSLYLRPEFRRANAGKLLSRVRFLFMALHPERFSTKIIAEMRGVCNDAGQSPFWDWLKTHFVDMEFSRATHLVGSGYTDFIDELMPSHPLYTCLMSPEARAVISQVHEHTRPALRILEAEGFQHKGFIDLFDAGPTVECALADINSVKSSSLCKVSVGPETGKISTGSNGRYEHASSAQNGAMIVTNTATVDFRATVITPGASWFQSSDKQSTHNLMITSALAEKLRIADGHLATTLPLGQTMPAATPTPATESHYAY
ncbi:arginine N-succinyltransferase [Streptosporangium jomthongense]|uniref:Arginine N-succinyltransferase n=1 Tax=Marinobacter aromaticivorans TaxID=1494078 RepID=A0ABW2IR16_9GAMM|nr:arginine N-succinyltransferase [Marinobacter aromaticivorans]GGE55891.1 arginine N-succinyltransferase [Streptosporangium jomthongense]